LNSVEHPVRKADSFVLLDLIKEVTGDEPQMWGPSIIGFGSVQYTYASGRKLDWVKTGFSPRNKGCLYINKLADVDKNVLKKLIKKTIESDSKLISG